MNPILIWLMTLLQATGVPVQDAQCMLSRIDDTVTCDAPAPPPPPPSDSPRSGWGPRNISNGF